jgi:membrane-associated HD superfamily phosphohydrolase
MRKLYASLLVLALIALVACAKPPQQQIDAAKTALAAAKTAQADIYAPDSLKAAVDKEAALDAELATQQSKFFKSYKVATQLTTELQQLADKAKADAVAGKEKAKADAEAAIAAADAAVVAAREALTKAPKGKGSTADVAAMTGDVDAAAASIEAAKADMTAEKYFDAKTKADSAKASAEKVSADVAAAIELKKGGKK